MTSDKFGAHLYLTPDELAGRGSSARTFLQRLDNFRDLRRNHHGHSGFHNPGLFARYQLKRIAENGLVIKADIGDATGARGDDVGGVQPPAHADFDHGHVHLLLREPGEGQVRQHLKIRRPPLPGGRTAHGLQRRHGQGQQAREIRFRDMRALDANAFAHVLQMRRSIEAGLESRRAEDGFGKGAGRAFPFRSRDVEAGESVLRIAQARSELAHAVERDDRLQAGRERLALNVDESVQVGEGGCVVHWSLVIGHWSLVIGH